MRTVQCRTRVSRWPVNWGQLTAWTGLVFILFIQSPALSLTPAQTEKGYLFVSRSEWVLKKDPAQLSGIRIRWNGAAPKRSDPRVCRSTEPRNCKMIFVEGRLSQDGTLLQAASLKADQGPGPLKRAEELIENLKARP
jgi:hypothetical protein